MIKVIVSSNTDRKTDIVPGTTTIRQLLEDNQIPVGVGTVSLDGIPLHPNDFDKSLDEMDVNDSCFLTSVVKSDNAR
jgi:hypothetical protein